MLTNGDIIGGRYLIEERVGSGGYAIVYRARDRKAKRDVAVKVLLPDLANDPDYQRRFQREADIAQLLVSDNVIKVLEIGRAEVRNEVVYFQVLEFVEGETLQERLNRGPIALRKALYIAAQLAEALDEAEQRGVVHGDVKPKNILIGKREFAKLGDFGIARAKGYPPLAVDGLIIGTPKYMSPEQLVDRTVDTDTRADIYSLGVVLFEMITGAPPFQGGDTNVITYQHLHEEPRAMKLTVRHIPDVVEALVKRCLGKLPEDRFQHASDLREALWSAIESLSSADDTPISPVGLKPSRLPMRYRIKRLTRVTALPIARRGAIAVLVVSVALGAGVALWASASGGDTATPIPITENPSQSAEPTTPAVEAEPLPPDASRIAYLRLDPTFVTADLVIAEGDGRGNEVIANDLNLPWTGISWSPLGDEIAYCGPPEGLQIVNSDGTNPRTAEAPACGQPQWSPNGEWIAFSSPTRDPAQQGYSDVYLIKRDGSGLRNLTNAADTYNSVIGWTPDSKAVRLFRSNVAQSAEAIVVNVESGAESSLPAFNGYSQPVWSPDDSHVLAVKEGAVYIIETESGNSKLLIEDALGPSWSPDGAKIAYIRPDGEEPWRRRLFVAGTDGGGAREITTGSGEISVVSWSPDGRQLAYALASEESTIGSTSVILASIDDPASAVIEKRGAYSPAWSPQLPVPYVSPRSLLREGATLDNLLYLNMNGSDAGQIVIQSSVEMPACAGLAQYGGRTSAEYIDIFSADASASTWSRVLDSSAWPSLTRPLVPLAIQRRDPTSPLPQSELDCWPILEVELSSIEIPNGTDQLAAIVRAHPGTSTGETTVTVLGFSEIGEIAILYGPQRWGGLVPATRDGNEVALEPNYYGPTDALCCPSGHSTVRLGWDEQSQRVIPKLISTELACETPYIQAINAYAGYLEAVCDLNDLRTGRHSISAFFDDTTAFSGLSSSRDLHVGQRVELELALLLPPESGGIPLSRVRLIEQPSGSSSITPSQPAVTASTGGCCLVWDGVPGATEYWIEARGAGSLAIGSDWELMYVLSGEGVFYADDDPVNPIVKCCEWDFFNIRTPSPFPMTGSYTFRVSAWNTAGQSLPSQAVTKSYDDASLIPTFTPLTLEPTAPTTFLNPTAAPAPTAPAAPTPGVENCVQDVGEGSTLIVPGAANIYGSCRGTTPSADGFTGGTIAPGIRVAEVTDWISFPFVTGTVAFAPGWNSGADGSQGYGNGTVLESYFGISGINCPYQMFLVGVFTTELAPSSPVPPGLDFTDNTDFLSLAPALGQLFFVGDGRSSSGDLQQFAVPAGATRLYLGFADGGSAGAFRGLPQAYHDNTGELTVNVRTSN